LFSHETSDTARMKNSETASTLSALRRLCAEVYQIAGEMGADGRVLDNLWAGAEGKPLPHRSLLPSTPRTRVSPIPHATVRFRGTDVARFVASQAEGRNESLTRLRRGRERNPRS
jgi:hypothetical protein